MKVYTVPHDHRIVFHHCENPTLICGTVYENVSIPVVQRRRDTSYYFDLKYHDNSEWTNVGIFDMSGNSYGILDELGMVIDEA